MTRTTKQHEEEYFHVNKKVIKGVFAGITFILFLVSFLTISALINISGGIIEWVAFFTISIYGFSVNFAAEVIQHKARCACGLDTWALR